MILNFPLRDNPFFAKVISIGNTFNGDGIEDGESDSSGYICQTLGNLDCDEDHKPQCSGLGVIDCTDDCAGTEEEFKMFMTMMEDKDFETKYPTLAKHKIGNIKKEEENTNGPSDDKGNEMIDEEDMCAKEKKPNERAKFFNEIKKCKDFSDETQALINMASGTGGSFGGDTSDPNSLTYVDPSAISNIASIEYDYSDYYDEDEVAEDDEDIGKERRYAEKEDDIEIVKEETTNVVEENNIEELNGRESPVKMNDEDKEILKVEEVIRNGDQTTNKMKHESKSKEDYYLSLNNLDNVDSKLLTEDEKISLNMIRSVDEEQELNDTNFVEKVRVKTLHLIQKMH